MNNQSRPITPPPKKKSLNKFNKQRYDSLDGLRAYAAVGIVLMHVLSNITLKPSENYLTLKLIPFFTDFTLLFMIVSGFSLCLVIMSDSRKEPLLLILFTRSDMQGFCLILPAAYCPS